MKDKKGTIEALLQIISLALISNEIELYKRTINLIGHVHSCHKNLNKAIEAFKKLRDAAQEDKDYETKMYAYSQIGKCYAQEKEFDKAILCFKKEL